MTHSSPANAELLRCPFCGGEASILNREMLCHNVGGNGKQACGAIVNFPICSVASHVVRLWNTRNGIHAQWSLIDAARCVVDTFKKDEAQGYHTRDRQFAIEILETALSSSSPDYQSQAKATEGKAGMAGGDHVPVRRSTAGTGLQVGEAGADLPATSEHMDVTARRDGTLIQPQRMREALIHTICPHIKVWSDADDVPDKTCQQCPATVQTSHGEGVQMCRLNAQRAADAVLALTRRECGDAI